MKVSTKWLAEYVDLSALTPKELADKITLSGIEVDDVIERGRSIGKDKLVVGEVLTVEPVEESDHLKLTTVNIGTDTPSQLVCGGPNVAVGQKVIVALPGAELPGGQIKKGSFLGHTSEGMICSLQELNYDDSVIAKEFGEGIYVFPNEVEVGQNAVDALAIDDVVLDFDLTPNRADALSMRGVAYEVAAILDQKPNFDGLEVEEDTSEHVDDYVSVSVEDQEDTPVYKMRIVKDVKITDSPLWMQSKLMNAGIRPMDLVVDTTNYIMLKYGQPLHSFDYDQLGSKEIYVRRANKDEAMKTLDDQTRKLSTDNLVVTNGSEPVALAGVMGGFDSHITKQTTTVALEAAIFSPELVRKTASHLNLRSESSGRFEKGINWATVQEAVDEAAALIARLGNGQVVSGTAQSNDLEVKDVHVSITLGKINRSLGTDLTKEEVVSVFERLQFPVAVSEDERFDVTVPPRRWDISIEADLLEEVARIYGYENIPSTLPEGEATPGTLGEKLSLTRHAKRILEDTGLNEAITYALTTSARSNRFAIKEGKEVSLQWPMSKEHETLRMNLTDSLLEQASYNVARSQSDVALYEFGRVFYGRDDQVLPKEEGHLAGVLVGDYLQSYWNNPEKPVDFFTIKGILETLLDTLGLIKPVIFVKESGLASMHPGRTARLELDGETIGFIGQLHPLAAKDYDLGEAYVFELNFDALVEAEKDETIFNTIPRFPGSTRDVAFVVNEDVPHAEIIAVIEANGGEWLQEITLFDIYMGEHIEDGKKSVGYSLYFQNPQETLVEETVHQAFEQVKEALVKEFSADIR